MQFSTSGSGAAGPLGIQLKDKRNDGGGQQLKIRLLFFLPRRPTTGQLQFDGHDKQTWQIKA